LEATVLQQTQQDPQQQQIGITLPLGAWQVVLEILNEQPYNKVAALIGAIVQQANAAQAQAQGQAQGLVPNQRANGGMDIPNYSPPNDGT
jgi:hypothetical protein